MHVAEKNEKYSINLRLLWHCKFELRCTNLVILENLLLLFVGLVPKYKDEK